VHKLGTDESVFRSLLCTHSLAQIRLMTEEYKKRTGHELESEVRKEFADADVDVRNGLITICTFHPHRPHIHVAVKMAKNPIVYFSEKLNESMKGVGTNDDTLIRIIVSRSEVDRACNSDLYSIHKSRSTWRTSKRTFKCATK